MRPRALLVDLLGSHSHLPDASGSTQDSKILESCCHPLVTDVLKQMPFQIQRLYKVIWLHIGCVVLPFPCDWHLHVGQIVENIWDPLCTNYTGFSLFLGFPLSAGLGFYSSRRCDTIVFFHIKLSSFWIRGLNFYPSTKERSIWWVSGQG